MDKPEFHPIPEVDRNFAGAMKQNPFVKEAVIAMLKNDIDYCEALMARPTTEERHVTLCIGRIDQSRRILKRMEIANG
jgi:hypothetical protein